MDGEKGQMNKLLGLNAAQLIAAAFQLGALVWFAATLSAKVDNHDTQIAEARAQIKVVTETQSVLSNNLAEMKGELGYQRNILENINQIVLQNNRPKKQGG